MPAGGCCSGSPPPLGEEDLRLFVELVLAASAARWTGRPPWRSRRCFNARTTTRPRCSRNCSHALQHLSLAAPVLDLSNYLVPFAPCEPSSGPDRAGRTRRAVGEHRAATVETRGVARRHRRRIWRPIRHQVDEGVALVVATVRRAGADR